MRKLVKAFSLKRDVHRAEKLIAYIEKFPMSVCLATPEEAALIDLARSMVRGG